jgi:8-amino-7-oxononanoate synthase
MQKLTKASELNGLPVSFLRSLESGLEHRRRQNQLFQLQPPAEQLGLVDFGSNNSLGIRTDAHTRERFLEKLAADPGFFLGSGGSRVLDGSSRQIADLEKYLASYHGAEDALIFNSGYEANVAIWSSLPRPGDVIIHDEMIHGSIRDGIKTSRVAIVKFFAHNNVESLRGVLQDVCVTSPDILQGRHTVFIAIESFYSMDGDASPITEMVEMAKDILPNTIFIVDEAHSTGLIGPQGSGYVRHLGLERGSIIQMQSYAKAPGAMGG